jgi:hypothetical protein
LQDAVAEVLHQGELLLNSLKDEDYTRKVPNVFGSTVGGHYRHCLDHFQSLLQGLDADEINYDHRHRDPRIENRNEDATRKLRQVQGAIRMLRDMLPGILEEYRRAGLDHGHQDRRAESDARDGR